MRDLTLRSRWAARGAKFGSLCGAECVESFGDVAGELFAIRNTAALCDFSFSGVFEFDEADGAEFLDSKLAANILKLRYGKVIDTFLANRAGRIVAEVFVGNADDKIVAVSEQIDGSAALELAAGASADLSGSRVLLSVDGPLAWKVVREVFGSDILNLSFLSMEKYDFEGACVFLMRNGRTGEFGYQFLAPSEVADSLCEKIEAALGGVGGRVCGFGAHEIARMEGNFFNVYKEGVRAGCPLELGLQWMADFEKESFSGSEAILSKRESGLKRRLTGIMSSGKLEVGCALFDGAREVGVAVAVSESPSLKTNIGLALIDAQIAMPGVGLSPLPGAPVSVSTVSRPFIVAESLKRGMED